VVTLRELRALELPVHREYVERFLRGYGVNDQAGMHIDGGPAGVMFVGVAVTTVPEVTERDVAVLRALRRHLTPLATDQLARDRSAAAARWSLRLTPREREIAELAAQGMADEQIAERLFLAPGAVEKLVVRVLTRLRCSSRTQLAVRWQQQDAGSWPV
jgi:DNA-binding NarL/FixJ family response regulator